jgi:5-methylphenazine-1-carboxylate 1-monooxygenase
MKVLIAGAGIGGLVTALVLHRAGFDVEVFERADEVRELGVGINMLPHAVREMADLGLMPDLDTTGIRPRELIYANRFGQIVWQEPRGVDAGFEVPQISIHRGKLLSLIHNAATGGLGSDFLHLGCRVTGFEETAAGVTVQLAGKDGSSSEARGDLLVGADGIHSAIRSALYPNEGPPIWNGTMLWRGAARWPVWRDGRTMIIAGGNVAKFVYYPIEIEPDNADLCLTNWAVMAKTGEEGELPLRAGDWSRLGRLEEVLPFVRDRFCLDFVDPAALIAASGDFYEYPNCDRDPLPRWSFGRVTLLGDAAHPMYPMGSNGASQAILDARSLATHLIARTSVEQALSLYDVERRPATSAIVLANRKGGPEAVIDMIEARAPHGFDDIESLVSFEERQSVVRGYASLAGFAGPT